MAYGDDVNNMMAPAQDIVRQFQRPYAMIGNGMPAPQLPGFLSHIPFLGGHVDDINESMRNAAPSINMGLDNALLSAAMVPEARGPEGVGGGISRALQGVLGANQFRRQQAISNAMMPYQMMMPQIDMMDKLSQMKERNAQSAYMQKHGDYLDSMIDTRNHQKTVQGSKTSDDGSEWQEIFDPVSGNVRLKNPVSGKYADELGTDDQPKFENQKKAARIQANGGFEGDLVRRLTDADPAIRTQAEKERDAYTSLESKKAYNSGAQHTAGSQGADHTYDEAKDFRDSERKHMYDDIVPLSQKQGDMAEKLAGVLPNGGKGVKSVDDWRSAQQNYANQRSARDQQFADYENSGAWKNKTSFKKWQQNGSNASGPDSSNPSGGTGTGSNWSPSNK